MNAPELWLNGRQITGAGRAPVLGNVRLIWGDENTEDQAPPETLNFTVMFLDGLADLPDLENGAEVELTHPGSEPRPVFAGSITTMTAGPSTRRAGAMEIQATAVGTVREFENLFQSLDLPAGTSRPADLVAAFSAEGWAVDLPADPRPSAKLRYNSIKLATVLDRHITRYRGRRFDMTYRDETGRRHKRLVITEGSPRTLPADTLAASPAKKWTRTYSAPQRDGAASPLAVIPARNVRRDTDWTQEPGNTTTAVQLTPMKLSDDGFTGNADPITYRAPRATLARYGMHSIDVETDLDNPQDWEAAARAWMNDDSPWKISGLEIVDSAALPADLLADLLASDARNRMLLILEGVLANRPDSGSSALRSYLTGGEYTWTGKAWNLALNLERSITPAAPRLWTFTALARDPRPEIYAATFESIGESLTFGDFAEIMGAHPEAPQPAGQQWTFTALARDPLTNRLTLNTLNPRLTFADFANIRRF